jgi:hypothetical protein
MTEAIHPHGTASHVEALFPPAEWQAFHESDRQAATAIVVLMVSIFSIGVVLYSIVYMTL